MMSSSKKRINRDLSDTESEEEEDAYTTPKRPPKYSRAELTNQYSKDQRAVIQYGGQNVNQEMTDDDRQIFAYMNAKGRTIKSGDEDKVKDCVKKHIISRAKFLQGEGLEPNIVRIQMERERGRPLIGLHHNFPDLVNPKGMYRTILDEMKILKKDIEKRVQFWVTWRKTIANCIKVHRNAVTSKMKNAILKGTLRYS